MIRHFRNLFADLPAPGPDEFFETLLNAGSWKLERIVSYGQATPVSQFFDQDRHEWVLLLEGAAGIQFEGVTAIRELRPGDSLFIRAHQRHRVAWTKADLPTIWLALHFAEDPDDSPLSG